MTSDPSDDNAMRAALRKAALTKREERQHRQEQRREIYETRLNVLRSKQPGKPKPGPQRPAWDDDDDAPLPNPDPAMDELRKQMEYIANSGGRGPVRRRGTSHPVVVERLPDRSRAASAQRVEVAPPAPPEAPLPETRPARMEVPAVRSERPLQTSPFPEGFAKVLEEGTPDEIAATRDPATLRGVEREAYDRAVARQAAAQAPEVAAEPPEVVVEPPPAAADATLDAPRRGGAGKPRPSMVTAGLTPIGQTIVGLRIDRGLTSRKFAAACGLSVATVYRISTGERDMLESERAAMAGVLGVGAETLGPAAAALPGRGRPINRGTVAKTNTKKTETKDQAAMIDAHAGDTVAQAVVRNYLGRVGKGAVTFANNLGLAHDTIGRWLRVPGQRLSNRTIERIAAALKIPADELAQDVPAAKVPTRAAPAAFVPDTAAASAAAQAAAQAEMPADESAEPAPFVAPPIEKGIPVPLSAIIIHADRYNWAGMGLGDSFFAECPFGMPLDLFEQRFASLIYRQQKKSGAWYVSEPDRKQNGVRVWRVA